jgi:hypothetical protein
MWKITFTYYFIDIILFTKHFIDFIPPTKHGHLLAFLFYIVCWLLESQAILNVY